MGGWGVPKSGRGIYMLDTWNPGKFEHPKDLDHPHEVKNNLAPSKIHYTCPTWSWGVAGWLIPECFNNYIIYQCMYIYIFIYFSIHLSIPSIFNLTLTLQLHKLQTSSIHYLTSHWPCNRATPVHHFWQSCWKTMHDCVDAPSGLAVSLRRLASHGWCGQ